MSIFSSRLSPLSRTLVPGAAKAACSVANRTRPMSYVTASSLGRLNSSVLMTRGLARGLPQLALGSGAGGRFAAVTSAPALGLTPAARERFNELLKKRDMVGGAIEISVKEKGCAGLSYGIEFRKTAEPQFKAGQAMVAIVSGEGTEKVTILIDRKSLGYLIGCEIDWVEGDVSSQFVFKNPNSTHSCPCGRSFSA